MRASQPGRNGAHEWPIRICGEALAGGACGRFAVGRPGGRPLIRSAGYSINRTGSPTTEASQVVVSWTFAPGNETVTWYQHPPIEV